MIYYEYEQIEKNGMHRAIKQIDALEAFMPSCEYNATTGIFKVRISDTFEEEIEMIMLAETGEIPSKKEYQ